MVMIYRTDGAWGVGQGSNLAPAQVDNNFYDLELRVTYIENNPVLPIEPISITIAGYNFYMGLSNGETLGPVVMTLPVPEWRGDWTPSTLYHDMDFIIAPDGGFGAVMQEHTSAATFDWAATDPDNGLPQYRLIVGSNGMTVAYSDLTDVALSGLADHDMPAWDGTAGYWRNRTPTQVTATLPAFTGDSGSGGAKGLVPAPAPGDEAAGKVLGAGGAWVVVSGGGTGGVTGPGSSVNNNLAAFNGTTGGAIKDSGIAASAVLVNGGALGTPSSGSAVNLVLIPVNQATGILGATHGGAGSVSGLLKANGIGNVSAAVPDVDYALPGSSGASVTIAATPPSSPAAGDLWWDSSDGGGNLYVWYQDANSSQWVITVSQPGPAGPAGPTGATGPTGPAGSYTAGTGIGIAGGTITNTLAASGGTVGGDLTVNGGSAPDPLKVTTNAGLNARTTHEVIGLRKWNTGCVGDNGRYSIADESALAERITISVTGVCSASSTWGVISDRRLKQSDSIEEYPRGLQEILALNPIYYQWNGKGGVPADGEIHFGLAAQDVEEVLPELIREHEYTPREGSDDEPMTVKTYSPTDLVFSLVNAIKALQAQIDELRAVLPPGVRP